MIAEGRAEFYNIRWDQAAFTDDSERLVARLQSATTSGRRMDTAMEVADYPRSEQFVKRGVLNKVHCLRCKSTGLLQYFDIS